MRASQAASECLDTLFDAGVGDVREGFGRREVVYGEGAVVAGDPTAADEQIGGHVEEGVGRVARRVDRFTLRHVDALHVRFGAASQRGGFRSGLCGGLLHGILGGAFG